jgi:hypothetical protein
MQYAALCGLGVDLHVESVSNQRVFRSPQRIQRCYENMQWPSRWTSMILESLISLLISTRVMRKSLAPLPLPRHLRRSPIADAAVGVCASGTKILRRGRRAHYLFLRASCPALLGVAWRLVALCGPSMGESCVLNWPWDLVLLRN